MIDAHQAVATLAAQSPRAETQNPVIRRLFLHLHGYYGNLFVSKFSTGERDSTGKDKGIRAAMLVWDSELSKFPSDVVESAMSRLSSESPDFPPNLPQFVRICQACMPRKTYFEENAIPRLAAPETRRVGNVEYEAKHDGKDWARKILAGIEAGDKRTVTVRKMAMDALGIRTEARAA